MNNLHNIGDSKDQYNNIKMSNFLSYNPPKFNREEFTPLEGTNYLLHPMADPEGGIKMEDNTGVLPGVVSSIIK